MRGKVIGGAALLLAGCGGGDRDAYNEVHVDARQAQAQANIDAAVNQTGPHEVALSGVPVSSPTPNAARDRAFPTPFGGYWGATPNDCELANYAATGRIDIDNDTIRFFESKARVQTMTVRSPTQVDTLLRFSGDGQNWQRPTRFTLEQGGTTLVRAEPGDGGRAPLTVRYKRC